MRLARTGWLALGLAMTALGLIGAVVPLMPTTIFLILAAACFTRSSPPLEHWLLDHPRFGPTLTAWRRSGAIGARAKVAACTGMALGLGLFWFGAHPNALVFAGVALALAACAAFVISRPTA